MVSQWPIYKHLPNKRAYSHQTHMITLKFQNEKKHDIDDFIADFIYTFKIINFQFVYSHHKCLD